MSVTLQIRVTADSGLPVLYQRLGKLKDCTGLNRNLFTKAANLTRVFPHGLTPTRPSLRGAHLTGIWSTTGQHTWAEPTASAPP